MKRNALDILPPFCNEPFTDFSSPGNADQMRAALARVRTELGQSYGLVLGGQRLQQGEPFISTNPAQPGEIIGHHFAATPAFTDQAVAAAQVAFPAWSRRPATDRVELLLRTAALIRERHFEFCAWLILEVGKNWAEADADVGECIDFLEFYAREALRLDAATTPIQYPGERNQLRYIALGVGAVIPPWNFPLAIMAGMTAAAIVTGNTVVLKPSPDAPTIAARFLALLEEAGLPVGVVNLLQGGPDVGRALVDHSRVRFIAFTGSKKVGLEIHEHAARMRPEQTFLKRTILELGGKDSIVVASDADLDAALDGTVSAAFSFSGQKCSACSRVIVEASVYDAFCAGLQARVQALTIGDPAGNAPIGPVINAAARQRIQDYIALGRTEATLLAGEEPSHVTDTNTHEAGYFVRPTIFAGVSPDSPLAQEEIFGPVLAVIRAESLDHALGIANDTVYGLTGAIYSGSRGTLDRAALDFHVGNLYLNRKCTGAMVGAHPFGGFNLSGTDSKAGGPDYLLLFTQAKSIAEKQGYISEKAEEQEQRMGL